MNIELRNKDIYWELQSAVDNYRSGNEIDLTQIELEVAKLLYSAESCKKMIDNRRKISNKDFYNMLNEFAYVNGWNDYDCYNVMEMAYNMKFAGFDTIKTSMQHIVSKTEGHGRDFSWWDEKVGINFKILYTNDFKVEYEHIYTINEIKKLLDEKKIVIICEEERDLSYDKKGIVEDYQAFDYAYDDYNMQYEFFNENGKFFLYTLKYIKKKVSSKKLKKIFSEYLDHVNSEVNSAIDKSLWSYDASWNFVTEEVKKEFEQCGYLKRLMKLNEDNVRR